MYLRPCGPSGVHTASILRKRKNEYDYVSLDKGIIIFFEIYLQYLHRQISFAIAAPEDELKDSELDPRPIELIAATTEVYLVLR